jgi:hypothetical protein
MSLLLGFFPTAYLFPSPSVGPDELIAYRYRCLQAFFLTVYLFPPPSVSPIRIIDYRSWLSSPTSCSIQLRLDCLHIIFLHYRTWPFLMLSSHNLSATATVGSYSWYICVWINTDIAHCTFPSEPITKELTEIKISKLHTHPLWSIFLTTVEPIGWIDNRSWLRYGF